MKTKTVSSRLALFAIAISAALLTEPAFGSAVTPHQFVFTEKSFASLSVTYDGVDVLIPCTGPGCPPDTWNFGLGSATFVSNGSVQWFEPGSSTLVNFVNFGTAMTHEGTVLSDISLYTQFPVNADRASVLVGTVGGVDVFATFHDKGDAATVPDTGTTASLFGLSLAGLVFLRRKLC
jgi:hypothetical protein